MFHVEHRRMDYHLHTNHSMDGRQTMPELCETMLARGVQEIALTEHIEPGHPEEEMDVPPVWADWFAEIARCRAAYPALVIRSGIEIGDNPLCRAETKALLDAAAGFPPAVAALGERRGLLRFGKVFRGQNACASVSGIRRGEGGIDTGLGGF